MGLAFTAFMAGWPEEFVIPKIAIHAPDRVVLFEHDVHDPIFGGKKIYLVCIGVWTISFVNILPGYTKVE